MKNLIVILLLLFSLNINFNPGYVNYSRQRNAVVYIINYEEDNLTTDTIDKTRRSLIEMYLSLLIDIKAVESYTYIDTS